MTKRWKILMKKLKTFSCDAGNAEALMNVPHDVKKGQVAVIAVDGERTKRFVLELEELYNPNMLRLLEQAKEEFGYQNEGPIAVPCRPEEIQKALEDWRKN